MTDHKQDDGGVTQKVDQTPVNDVGVGITLLERAIDLFTDDMTGRGYNRELALAITRTQEAHTWAGLGLAALDPRAAAQWHINIAIRLAEKHGFMDDLQDAAMQLVEGDDRP